MVVLIPLQLEVIIITDELVQESAWFFVFLFFLLNPWIHAQRRNSEFIFLRVKSPFAKEDVPKGGSNMLFFESSPQAQRLR